MHEAPFLRGDGEWNKVSRLKGKNKSLKYWPLVVGVVCIGMSAACGNSHPWFSSLFMEAGVAILLIVPVEYYVSLLRRQFAQVESVAEMAANVVEDVGQEFEDVLKSLGDIEADLVKRYYETVDEELDVYRRIRGDLTLPNVLSALGGATRENLISSKGVCVEDPAHLVYYGFFPNVPYEGHLRVSVESREGALLGVRDWEPGVAAEVFLGKLEDVVKDGVGLDEYNPGMAPGMFRCLSDMLVDIKRKRAQPGLLGRKYLRDVIMKNDGWYFTEEYIIPESRLYYRIEVDRLDEMDWESHLRDRHLDASDVIRLAKRLRDFGS